MKRLVLIVLVIALVVGVVGYMFRGPIALRLMQRVVARTLASTLLDEVPDGLHVGLCGAGSPMADAMRSGPCVAVIAGRELYIVDSGSGSSRVLSRMRLPQGRVQGILLTHFHSDHIDGLGELLLQHWAAGGNATPALVYGPPGVEQVVAGFNTAYAQDAVYRVAHHGEAVVPPAGAGGTAQTFLLPALGQEQVVLERDGLKVTAFRVEHEPVEPAVGYRFDYRGRSAVISGDTKKSANLQQFARGADLLVHEALAPQLVAVIKQAAGAAGIANIEKIMGDILTYHTTPVEAAEIAHDAGVKHLVYYHIVPPLPLAPLQAVFLEGVDETYTGPVTVGQDGTFVSLPAGSTAIDVQSLL